MKGGMKLAEILCRKGFPPSDGRDEGIFEVKPKSRKERKRRALHYIPSVGASDSQAGNKTFPRREHLY